MYGEYGVEVPLSKESLGHLHKVERDLNTGSDGRFGDAAGSVSHAGIEALEFSAVVDEAEFHFTEARGTAASLGGDHEFGAETGALARGFHGDKADVGARSAWLDVEAGRELSLLFAQEKSAAGPDFAHRAGVDALAFDVGTFGDEGTVDEADDGVNVGGICGAEGEDGHSEHCSVRELRCAFVGVGDGMRGSIDSVLLTPHFGEDVKVLGDGVSTAR